MSISLEEVRHVARLARLELDAAELEEFQGELNALLAHFADINEIDTTGLEAKPHAVPLVNVMRDDAPGAHLLREDALKGSAKTRAGLFIVPAILEDQG